MEDWNWKTIFYGYYRSIFNHCEVIGLQSYRIRWKKTQKGLLRHSRSFKAIEIGTNRKPVCDFLVVINSNWHPISYRFGVIAPYCSNFGHCVYEILFAGLRDNVRCSSWAHWKARSRLPISDNGTFSLGVTAEALRVKYLLKIGDFAPTGAGWTKITGRRGRPQQTILFFRKLGYMIFSMV